MSNDPGRYCVVQLVLLDKVVRRLNASYDTAIECMDNTTDEQELAFWKREADECGCLAAKLRKSRPEE